MCANYVIMWLMQTSESLYQYVMHVNNIGRSIEGIP